MPSALTAAVVLVSPSAWAGRENAPLTWTPTSVPLTLPFEWAATRTILPVLWVLHNVAVEVLPNIEKPLTVLGGRVPTLLADDLILLTQTSGPAALSKAVVF